MISLPLGALVMTAVLIYSLAGSSLDLFVNYHAIVLVVAGTLGLLALTAPMAEIKALFRMIWSLRRPDRSLETINRSLIEIARKRDVVLFDKHPLIAYAQELWEQGVDNEIFGVMLVQKLEELNGMTDQAVHAMRNLAKYPPALGMTGTVIGLVGLFSGLTIDSRDKIGPSLALAMTATFYGLVLSNALIMPLADRLSTVHLARIKTNEHVYRALMLIHQGEPQAIMSGSSARAAS